MQNDRSKCGLTEQGKGIYVDLIPKDMYVWYEDNWQHDEHEHLHARSQLTFVEEGYQYFHLDRNIYLVPKNHVIWIPSGLKHRVVSEASQVKLMVVLFKSDLENSFFQDIHVFPAPAVLIEMLRYASKWNKLLTEDEEQAIFLKALQTSLPNFCKESNYLQIPVPGDQRLLSVCNYINNHYTINLKIEELAAQSTLSIRTLQRLFKKETGITLKKYIQLIRVLKSIELIDTKQNTLSEIGFMVGYKSLAAFTASYYSIMRNHPNRKY